MRGRWILGLGVSLVLGGCNTPPEQLDPKARGYIILTEPACYRFDTIRYASINAANPGPGGATLHFTGRKVAYPLWSSEIGYFLREAPHSERGATSTSQALREPCAP
jgi:hypothetical protein